MRKPNILKAVFILFFCGLTAFTNAQAKSSGNSKDLSTSVQKPYKVLTNGKQITVQSKQILKSVLVWTASGHRIVEQKKIDAASFSFTITVKEKIFFIMVEMEDGKRYTSKLGVN